MTKRAVFVNLGFDPTAALDIISTFHLSSGDQLILIYPAGTEEGANIRAEQARNAVRNQIALLRVAGRRIRLDELPLDLNSFTQSLERLIERMFIAKKEGYSIVLELSGGVRAITILAVMVSMWFPQLVDEFSFIVEVTRQRIFVPALSPLLLSFNSLLRVLSYASSKSEGVKRRDIARALNMSAGSVSRAISRLKKMGLVNEKLRVLTIRDKYSVLTPIFKRFFTDVSPS